MIVKYLIYLSDGFVPFFRNRKEKLGGGVCIMIPEHQKNDAVQVYSGRETEIIAVRLNNYSPPVTLICMYGSHKRDENSEYGLSELDNVISSQLAQGIDVDRKSTRLNSSHSQQSRMPSSA